MRPPCSSGGSWRRLLLVTVPEFACRCKSECTRMQSRCRRSVPMQERRRAGVGRGEPLVASPGLGRSPDPVQSGPVPFPCTSPGCACSIQSNARSDLGYLVLNMCMARPSRGSTLPLTDAGSPSTVPIITQRSMRGGAGWIPARAVRQAQIASSPGNKQETM